MKFLSRLFLIFMLAQATVAQAAIIPSIPYNLTNGSLADATQVMGNFNTIVTDTNANGAKNGANNDITSLTGLTTALSHALGGTVVYTGGTTGGSTNAQTLASVTPSAFALVTGEIVTGVAGFSNSTAATLNVSGTGNVAIRLANGSGPVALVGGEIIAGGSYAWIYDGTFWEMLNSSGYAAAVNTALTGVPNAPTASPGTNTTQIATTAFVATSFAPLASPTFTGAPSLPTGAVGVTQAVADASTKLATTAFVNPSTTNSANGSVELPSGIIMKWGTDSSATNPRTISFAGSFPTACYSVVPVANASNQSIQEVTACTTSGFTVNQGNIGSGVNYIAFGH